MDPAQFLRTVAVSPDPDGILTWLREHLTSGEIEDFAYCPVHPAERCQAEVRAALNVRGMDLVALPHERRSILQESSAMAFTGTRASMLQHFPGPSSGSLLLAAALDLLIAGQDSIYHDEALGAGTVVARHQGPDCLAAWRGLLGWCVAGAPGVPVQSPDLLAAIALVVSRETVREGDIAAALAHCEDALPAWFWAGAGLEPLTQEDDALAGLWWQLVGPLEGALPDGLKAVELWDRVTRLL